MRKFSAGFNTPVSFLNKTGNYNLALKRSIIKQKGITLILPSVNWIEIQLEGLYVYTV